MINFNFNNILKTIWSRITRRLRKNNHLNFLPETRCLASRAKTQSLNHAENTDRQPVRTSSPVQRSGDADIRDPAWLSGSTVPCARRHSRRRPNGPRRPRSEARRSGHGGKDFTKSSGPRDSRVGDRSSVRVPKSVAYGPRTAQHRESSLAPRAGLTCRLIDDTCPARSPNMALKR